MELFQTFLTAIGGPVTALMLLMSVVATCLILAKLWELAGYGRNRSALAEQTLEQLRSSYTAKDRNEALLLVRNRRAPRLQALAAALQLSQPGNLALQDIQEETLRIARKSLNQMNMGLRPLEVIANLSPLMGLFGTVLGMIEAFRAMEAAGSQVDPSVLSGGIWQALLTTAVGLAIAIPVSLIHSAFERTTEREAQETQDSLEQLFHIMAQQQQDITTATAAQVRRA
jgi:biopolymer transport protein ExbB